MRFAGGNKFFGGGESDSDESENSQNSENENPKESVQDFKAGAKNLKKKLLDDSDEEDAERTIRSLKEKKFEILDKILEDLRNNEKISDF